MASPFTVFRKNQKVLLAITGILAMIAFVFLGTCIKGTGPAQAYQNPTVVSWKFGDITEADMANRLQMRRMLNQFVLRAVALSGQRGDPLQFAETEDSIVRSMVLARRGRELKVVVSDEMVNRFLAQVTSNRVRPTDFERLTAQFKFEGRHRVTPKQIFEALREELLARQVAILFLEGLGVEGSDAMPPLDTPAQRWDYFRRFERQATVQVLPVPVAEFTDEVRKPSEEELQALFDKYKDRFPSPESPDPGFRQPYRARFQYFKTDIEELAKAEMDSVTDEEISEYYEKNKETKFRKSKLPPLEEEDAKKEAADKDAKENGVKIGKESDLKDRSATNGKERDAKEPVDAKRPDESSIDAKSNEEKRESKKPGEKSDLKPAKEKRDIKADETKKSDKSANRSQRSPFRLIKFQSDKTKPNNVPKADNKAKPNTKTNQADTKKKSSDVTKGQAQDGKAKKDSSKQETKGTKAPTTDATKASKTSDEVKIKAGSIEAAEEQTTKEKTTGKEDTAAPVTQKTADDQAVAKEEGEKEAAKKEEPASEPVEYRPLEQVRDEIRRTLARERAKERVKGRLEKLRAEMVRYAELRTRYQIEAATNPSERKPKPLDMESLAGDGVKAFTTDWLSALDARVNKDLDIARSYDMNLRTGSFQTWPQMVFQPKGLYRPITTVDLEENSYISWKTEEREGQIPEFKEARGEVLEAWKLDKARDLARKKAEEYAKTVRQAKQPMKEVFAQDKNLPVKEVGPFAWLTRPNVPFGAMQQQPPRHSQVPGVELAGQDFMQTTFNLRAGEVGVALNHPQSIAYVIQASNFEPSDSVLEQEFMVRIKNYDRYRGAGIFQLAEAQNHWMESLFETYGVRWHRAADVRLAMSE